MNGDETQATSARPRTKRARPVADRAAQFEAWLVKVRAASYAPLKELGRLSRAEQVDLRERAVRAGLEPTERGVRVPLEAQIARVVRESDEPVLEKTLPKRLRGTKNAAEVRHAVERLVGEGALVRLLEREGASLADERTAVLSAADVDALVRASKLLAELVKRAAKAQRSGSALARAEVRTIFDALPVNEPREGRVNEPREGRAIAASRADATRDEGLREALLDALRAAADRYGLSRVPDVVARLEAGHSRETLLATLGELASAGVVELRPEATVGRLTAEERARCPVGIDAVPLAVAVARGPTSHVAGSPKVSSSNAEGQA